MNDWMTKLVEERITLMTKKLGRNVINSVLLPFVFSLGLEGKTVGEQVLKACILSGKIT